MCSFFPSPLRSATQVQQRQNYKEAKAKSVAHLTVSPVLTPSNTLHIATFPWIGMERLCNDKSPPLSELGTKARLPAVCFSQVSCLSNKHASTCLLSTFPHIIPRSPLNSCSELIIYTLCKPVHRSACCLARMQY